MVVLGENSRIVWLWKYLFAQGRTAQWLGYGIRGRNSSKSAIPLELAEEHLISAVPTPSSNQLGSFKRRNSDHVGQITGSKSEMR